MLYCFPKVIPKYVLVIILFPAVALSRGPDKFAQCKARIDRIMNGTEVYGSINNETIMQYIYTGPVGGMNKDFARTSRDSFLTIKTEGCRVLCDDPVDWYWTADPALTLGIISNWVLPILAMIAALPYDSLHGRSPDDAWSQGRFFKTAGMINIWLGSPQTALTATLFNIHQMRKCLRATLRTTRGSADDESLERDAYYVLCCLGQFKLKETNDENLEILILGLFASVHPEINACQSPQGQQREVERQELSKQLLKEMAFQLRMLRRRGVYPTFINISLYFIAYAVSLVLAFGDMAERITAHSLAFGILISWFPLLVLFSVVDRNPVSAERSSTLISRWMWNVEAIRNWTPTPLRGNSVSEPEWWKRDAIDKDKFNTFIDEFVGQGRQIGYNGLPNAVLTSLRDALKVKATRPPQLGDITKILKKRLNSPRPGSWWVLSVASLGLVWLEIAMAVVISSNVPTVGVGCRVASYLIYGGLSSLPWIIHLLPWYDHPGTKRKTLCHAISGLSTLTLFFITFAAFSGVLRNCFCRGGASGYLDFENSEFYRDRAHFDVAKYWWTGAIIGALPLFVFFFLASSWLLTMKPLWRVSERDDPRFNGAVKVGMEWLR